MGEKSTKSSKLDMPPVWFSLKKSLHCKSEPSDVHDPTAARKLGAILTRKRRPGRSGCSRSIANLKDVIHGSKRHLDKPPSCSPRSIGSSDFLNPITHEVILNSNCELKITSLNPTMQFFNPPATRSSATPPRKSVHFLTDEDGFRASFDLNSQLSCHKCGEQLLKPKSLESHHLSRHAVTELGEGDSSRKIVEIICRSKNVRIDRILKVHNTARTVARFEEYREAVKQRAARLPKKHPRCLADGNELLRFHGTTVACAFRGGACPSDGCHVCRIIRLGFSAADGGVVGVFTASTSGRAYESVEEGGGPVGMRKAVVVCRVIAGRVHRPVPEIGGLAGFDSLAGKVGAYSNIEELYLLNPRALLPCFVVVL